MFGLLAINLSAATGKEAPPALLKQIAAMLSSYHRDVTEMTLNVKSTVTFLNSSDKVIKTRRSSHIFELTASRRNGDHQKATASMKDVDRGTMTQLAQTDMFAIAAGLISPGKAPLEQMEYVDSGPDVIVLRSVSNNDNCRAFEARGKQWQLHEWCGRWEIEVDGSSMHPLRLSFQAGGLPVVARKKRALYRYQVEQQFHILALPGDKRTFLLPKKITAVYHTDKGSTIVESEYTPE
ncbi:MAG: hypothetical protein ACE14L_10050 [Terriglobales bacterium]